MKVVVGLGNPGNDYVQTRHNVGFIILDEFAKAKNLTWSLEKKFNAEICQFSDVILVKPQTFMNDSGTSVSKVLNFYKIATEDLLVIHDDVDLPFGKIKKQLDASSAGHNGVQNIIDNLGTQKFWRMRVGIGKSENTNIKTEDWVLMTFSTEELDVIKKLGNTLTLDNI